MKNLKRLLKKQYRNTIQDLSEFQVRYVVKSDLMKLVLYNRKDIKRHLRYFITNYIKILTYLKEDFNVQEIKYEDIDKQYNVDDIDKEITGMQGVYEHYISGKVFSKKFMKGITLIPTQKAIERLNVLNHLYMIYPQLLKQFEKHGGIEYKDINLEEISDRLEEAKHLNVKSDIDYIKKINKK